jgi:hypothetical protein
MYYTYQVKDYGVCYLPIKYYYIGKPPNGGNNGRNINMFPFVSL